MKKNILLDIDGVLANFYYGFGRYLNENYNAELDLTKEPPVYHFDEWGPKLKDIDAGKAARDWMLEGGHLNIPAYSGAKEFVEELMTLGNVHIVTARVGAWNQKLDDALSTQVMNDTYEWFRVHGIPVSSDTDGRIRFEHNKVDLCKDEGISIIIEDKLSTALQAAQEGIHAILVDRAWNQHPERFKIYRAFGYDDVLEYVRRIS